MLFFLLLFFLLISRAQKSALIVENQTDDVHSKLDAISDLCFHCLKLRGFCVLLEKEFSYFGRVAGSKKEYQKGYMICALLCICVCVCICKDVS